VQILRDEIQALNEGLYPNGTATGLLAIDSQIIYDILFKNSLPAGLPPVSSHAGAPDLRQPVQRLSEATGSTTNPDVFIATERDINAMKGRLWDGSRPMAPIRFEGLALNAARGDRSAQQDIATQFDTVSPRQLFS